MPRAQSSNIREYYHYDANTNLSTCLCNKDDTEGRPCPVKLIGSKVSNLKSHLHKKHPAVYNEFLKLEEASPIIANQYTPKSSSIGGATSSIPKKRLVKTRSYSKKTKLSIPMDRDVFLDGIVEMIVIDELPLSVLESDGLNKIIKPILSVLNFSLTRDSVHCLIHERYEMLRDRLKELTHKKLVNIKVDCVTRAERSFLGINVQLLHEGKMTTFTLVAIELLQRLTPDNLRNVILNELKKYDIEINQIYTVTVDDGFNLLSAVKQSALNEDVSQMLEVILMPNESECAQYEEPDDEVSSSVDHRIEQQILHDVEEINWQGKEYSIETTRCLSNAIQLCILNTLREAFASEIMDDIPKMDIEDYRKVIHDARTMVKKLLTHNNLVQLRRANLTKLALDCPTRWNSTYQMLKNLLELRPFGEELNLIVLDSTWDRIQQVADSLGPCSKAATLLQNEDLTRSDIYKIYNMCHMVTAQTENSLCNQLTNNFVRQQPKLFENDSFLATLYLDPRFNFDLTNVQRERAISHLLWLHNKQQAALQTKETDTETQNTPVTNSVNKPIKEDTDFMDLEAMYEETLAARHKNMKSETAHATSKQDFKTLCRDFEPNRLKVSESVIAYWEQNKALYPELYAVAQVVFSVPGTRLSIQRLLSQLNFILAPRQNRLEADIIDEILFLKSNFKRLSEIRK